jgi:ABC-2 type transport system permease protein
VTLLDRFRSFHLRRLLAVGRKEFLHIRRDKRMLVVIFLAPVLQLFLLGYAANFDVLHVPLMVVDLDRSNTSRAVATRLDAGDTFDLVGTTTDPARAEKALDDGTVQIVVTVPRDAERSLKRNEAVDVPVWVDGTDANRAMAAQGYVGAALQRVSSEVMPPGLALPKPGLPDVRARVLYNPALQSRWFMVPGVLAMILTLITVLLSSMAIVKEREQGNIEQLSVSPIRPTELIVGKLAPFVVIGLMDATLVFLVTIFGFQIPFRGSLLDLVLMACLYLCSTLGMGLFVSTVSSTQQQSMMSAILILMPSFLLGGVFYPIANMPLWARVFAAFVPLRYFINMVRGLFLKGIGFSELSTESYALALLGLSMLTFAVFRFRKRSA